MSLHMHEKIIFSYMDGECFLFEWDADGRWEAEVTFPFIAFLHTWSGRGCRAPRWSSGDCSELLLLFCCHISYPS